MFEKYVIQWSNVFFEHIITYKVLYVYQNLLHNIIESETVVSQELYAVV